MAHLVDVTFRSKFTLRETRRSVQRDCPAAVCQFGCLSRPSGRKRASDILIASIFKLQLPVMEVPAGCSSRRDATILALYRQAGFSNLMVGALVHAQCSHHW